jgi:uncharacterized protein YcgI (DUF1989 family)
MKLVQELSIPARTGKAFVVRAGQYLRVGTPDGPQVADMDVFNLENPREMFSSSRTRTDRGIHVTTSDPLYSTPPGERVMMTITADTLDHSANPRGTVTHDLLFGRCSRKGQMERHGFAVTTGCQENLANAVAEFDLSPDYVHDPLNVFMKTGLDERGKPFYEPTDSKAGDYVEFRAEIDCLVAISACPGRSSGPDPKGLGIQIFDP